jgi:hypothetical protein
VDVDPSQNFVQENLRGFSDDELLRKTKELTREERRLTVEVLHHLREVERRSLFISLGFDTLQSYAIRELGYSETAANRRIQAMRLIGELPEMAGKITEGQMNLTSAARVQSFLKSEAKGNKAYSRDQKLELIEALEHRPTREVSRELRRQARASTPGDERGKGSDGHGPTLNRDLNAIMSLDGETGEFALKLPPALHEKLDRLLIAKSVHNPELGYLDILEELLDDALAGTSTSAFEIRPRAESPSAAAISKVIEETVTQTRKRSRYISASIQKQVWQSYGHLGCTYVDSSTGRRCGSKADLEIDHIVPFAMGGRNELGNLRLVCSQHNRWRTDSDGSAANGSGGAGADRGSGGHIRV